MKQVAKNTTVAIALAASISMIVAGCGNTVTNANQSSAASTQTRTTGAAKNGGQLVISQYQPFDNTFIPNLSTIGFTQNLVYYAFDPLFTMDKNYNVVSDLADKYSWSADHKTITITLKPTAKWSDGQPITSDDVLLYLDFMDSKDYVNTYQGQLESVVDDIKGANPNGKTESFAKLGGFERVSDKVFKIHFAKKNIHEMVFNILSWYPLPSHILKGIPFSQYLDMNYDRMPSVTSGAYTFAKVNGTDSVVMNANPHYVMGKPHISSVVWKTVNADVAPGMLEGNQIDYLMNGVQPKDVANIEKMSNIVLHHPVDQGYFDLGLKDSRPYFKNVKVRQAFMYAINRALLVKAVVKGYGNVANTPISPTMFGYTTKGINPYAYSPSRANQLLNQAGWKKSSNGQRMLPGGKQPVNLTLGYPSNDPVRTTAAIQIQQDLGAVGIQVSLKSFAKSSTMYEEVASGQLDMWMGQESGLGPYPNIQSLWGSKNSENEQFNAWMDAKNDELIAAANSDKAANTTYYKNALDAWLRYMNQQVPAVFLWNKDALYVFNKRVEIPSNDWQGNGFQPIHLEQWWLQ